MLGDMEDVKRELAQQINGPVFLTLLKNVDLEKGDLAPTTPTPKAVLTAERLNVTGFGYPICELIAIRTMYEPSTSHSKFAMHEVSIEWTHQADDESVIVQQLERLVRATRDLFWPANGPTTLMAFQSHPILFLREDYMPLIKPNPKSPFVKGSSTLVRVDVEVL